jgi:hypothetical protein
MPLADTVGMDNRRLNRLQSPSLARIAVAVGEGTRAALDGF